VGTFEHLGTETRGDREVRTYGHVPSGDRIFVLIRWAGPSTTVEVLDEDTLEMIATTNESIARLDDPDAPPMYDTDAS
jgi:hypothetical protein